jgi:hypothetical protein
MYNTKKRREFFCLLIENFQLKDYNFMLNLEDLFGTNIIYRFRRGFVSTDVGTAVLECISLYHKSGTLLNIERETG